MALRNSLLRVFGLVTSVHLLFASFESDVGYRNAAYFVNWGIYARNYQPSAIPYDKLTHLFYAFANVKETGEVYLTDLWADVDKTYSANSEKENETDEKNIIHGCIEQIFLLKKKNRFLKTLLSIGGWTYSSNFSAPLSTHQGRRLFAETAVTLIKNLGFDGIDIDWEYPADETEVNNFVDLLQTARRCLDEYTTRHKLEKMLLTVASPAGPSHYQIWKFDRMVPYIDFFNIMAYDYADPLNIITTHQANLYPSLINSTQSTPFSTNAAIEDYVKAGVPTHKISLGMPLYGRAFQQTDGMGKSFHGVGDGSFEKGIWDYKMLPQSGATDQFDQEVGASYSWDKTKRILISYDTIAASNMKVDFIKKHKLGGSIFWELSGDSKNNKSLISNVFRGLGASKLNQSLNILHYPESKFDNIRAGTENMKKSLNIDGGIKQCICLGTTI